MNFFAWIAQEEALTSEALTVRAQALPPDDRDQLLHDIFFPRRNVDSMSLDYITDVDFRPASARREWNARGVVIPTRTPNLGHLEMVPVESYFKIDEAEMQKHIERTLGNEALFRQIVGTSIPNRVDRLVNANRRLLEFDAFRSWALGEVVVRAPDQNVTVTVDFNFDAARYQTAGTIWSDAGVNAYNEFLAWVEDGIDAVGSGGGAVMRRTAFREIQLDAPKGLDNITLTRAQVEDRLQQDLGIDFRFYLLENRLDAKTDNGLSYTRTNVWPAEQVALVPAGLRVGDMAYAPVARAFQLAAVAQDAEIDVRGMSVFREVGGNGRDLTVECQVNAFPLPEENRLWVIDVGV